MSCPEMRRASVAAIRPSALSAKAARSTATPRVVPTRVGKRTKIGGSGGEIQLSREWCSRRSAQRRGAFLPRLDQGGAIDPNAGCNGQINAAKGRRTREAPPRGTGHLRSVQRTAQYPQAASLRWLASSADPYLP